MANDFQVSRVSATQMYVSIWNSYTLSAPDIPFALMVVC